MVASVSRGVVCRPRIFNWKTFGAKAQKALTNYTERLAALRTSQKLLKGYQETIRRVQRFLMVFIICFDSFECSSMVFNSF